MSNIQKKESAWFVRFTHHRNVRIRLFCFHHAGGGAVVFQPWIKAFSEYVEVIAVQLPGRGASFDQPLITDLQTAVDQLYNAIQPLLDRPAVFFGHSLGGAIAFKLIKKLEENGQGPSHFIASGRSAPTDTKKHFPSITRLPDSEFLKGVLAYEGTPEQIRESQELLEIYLPILRADFCLADQDFADGIIDCPVTVFGGKSDRIPETHLRLWSKSTQDFRGVVMFEGAHFFIKDDQHAVLNFIQNILFYSELLY